MERPTEHTPTDRLPDDMYADARKAVEVIKKGGVIAYPTDTVWGLGCDASNPEAVARLFEIKKREGDKPMLVLVDSVAALERIVEKVPEVGYELVEAAVAPLTVIYDKGRGVVPALLGKDGSIGVRVTSEPFSQALCRLARRPIVSTSINFSGKPAPATFDRIDPAILEKVDYVCESRRDEKAQKRPSGIIKLSEGGLFKIIR